MHRGLKSNPEYASD